MKELLTTFLADAKTSIFEGGDMEVVESCCIGKSGRACAAPGHGHCPLTAWYQRATDVVVPYHHRHLGTAHPPPRHCAAAPAAICGPVADERLQCGPNLPEQGPTGWGVDTAVLQAEMGGAVHRICLVNDFVAVGFGLVPGVVDPADIELLHPGEEGARDAHGVMCAVGAGTGLGQVFLTWDSHLRSYAAKASEGGMAEFHARTEVDWALRQVAPSREPAVRLLTTPTDLLATPAWPLAT
jgi:glucokinase